MKRRSFLKGMVSAPAAAVLPGAAGTTDLGNGLARFADEGGYVIVNYTDKHVQVSGRPDFWAMLDQMNDYEDERLDLPPKPFLYISVLRNSICGADLNDGWTAEGLINVRNAVFQGFTAFDFITTRHYSDESSRLYSNKIRIQLDDNCLLIVPNDLLVIHKTLVNNEYVFMFDKSTETAQQHWEIKESAASWLNAVPL